MINVINYTKALTSLKDSKYRDCYIAKIEFKNFCGKDITNNINETYDVCELKSSKFMSIIQVRCVANSKILSSMDVCIILGRIFNNKLNREFSYEGKKEYFTFYTNRQIKEFSKLVNDSNPIHKHKIKSIVQGMMILESINKSINIIEDFKIRFVKPVYEMEKIYLSYTLNADQRVIYGIVNDMVCFKMCIGEE